MRGSSRVLVVGASTLGEAVARALPSAQVTTVDTLLAGLWAAGHEPVDAVVIALAAGRGALRMIHGLRQVVPKARVIVACAPDDEPRAREALQAGADDYVLEPIVPAELTTTLQLGTSEPTVALPRPLPSIQEILELSEVLKRLGEGLEPTLERLVRLLRGVFEAEGAVIRVGTCTVHDGAPEPLVLQEPLRRKDELVGTLGLGPRSGSPYLAADAARLADYARLVETIVAQITEQAHWQELAWRDDLSGLRNRRYFEVTLEQLTARAASQRLRVTVILLDIDDFKSYNDRYGHDTGDALIREVAVLLTRCSREKDVVVRYGGDEFAVILWDAEQPRVPGSQHPTDLTVLAERFQAAIRQHAFTCLGPGAPGPVTISGGLACFPWDGTTPVEILRAADSALLTAKRGGKNRILLAEKVNSEK